MAAVGAVDLEVAAVAVVPVGPAEPAEPVGTQGLGVPVALAGMVTEIAVGPVKDRTGKGYPSTEASALAAGVGALAGMVKDRTVAGVEARVLPACEEMLAAVE